MKAEKIFRYLYFFIFVVAVFFAGVGYSTLSNDYSMRDINIIVIVNSILTIGLMALVMSLHYSKGD